MDSYQAHAIAGRGCTALSEMLGEPMAGTSSEATTWLCLEQPGPWGREALIESHIDLEVASELAERVSGTGIRVALIRRPGNHPDRHRPIPHRVYLAHTTPGATWLERAWVADPKELLDLNFAAVDADTPSGIGSLVTDPLLLVCTNARRDVCCARYGRPIAAALARTHGEAVWECSHLGGHRFSPTALQLPTGYSYGRLDLDAAERLLMPGTGVDLERCRGRSTWSPVGQVAELAVRAAIGDRDPETLRLTEERSGGSVDVSHVDGRRWRVDTVERTAPERRSISCAATPTALASVYAESLRELVTG